MIKKVKRKKNKVRKSANYFGPIFVVSFWLICANAWADCIHNGNTYEEGAVIGNYICKDGRWVPIGD